MMQILTIPTSLFTCKVMYMWFSDEYCEMSDQSSRKRQLNLTEVFILQVSISIQMKKGFKQAIKLSIGEKKRLGKMDLQPNTEDLGAKVFVSFEVTSYFSHEINE